MAVEMYADGSSTNMLRRGIVDMDAWHGPC
jgi:hypothetical protein